MCAYQILSAFSSKNVWTLLKAFITYVRPKLEYNSPVWNPYPKKDTLLLESVQKKFTRNVFLRCNIPFRSDADRLDKLGIKSLEYRRLQFDIILMFKIYHKLSDLQFDNYCEHCDRKYNFLTFILITLKLNPNFAPILNNFVISFSFVLLMFGINYLMTEFLQPILLY